MVAVTAKHRQLDHVDLSLRISKEEEVESLAQAQRRLLHLRLLCGGQLGDKKLGPPVMVVFEGWDASGKGGAIRRLVAPLDPRHVRVAQFGPRATTSCATTSCGGSSRPCPGGAA